MINIDDLLAQFQQVMGQLSQLLGLLLAMIFIAAVFVILAQTQQSLNARAQQLALMRTLGAKRHLLQQMLRWEQITMGAVAGLGAALLTEVTSWSLLQGWFNLTWHPHGELWLLLPGLGVSALMICGHSLSQRLLSDALMTRLRYSD